MQLVARGIFNRESLFKGKKGFVMKGYPRLNIYFPGTREEELHEKMKRLAKSPWYSQDHNTHGKPADNGFFYFHHDELGENPSCTLCIARSEPGHWTVTGIVPDKGQVNPIPCECYSRMLDDFNSNIANPAADTVDGMTSIDIHTFRLKDYFSPQAVKKLSHFCKSANQCDLGHHPCDQERWNSFLIQVFEDNKDIPSCDIFGDCLKTAKLWPEDDIPRLRKEYDFAMRLFEQYERNAQ
ncbi:MAG: hypothetical protein JXA11_11945 [Phycisphaerae bacterium]|nr:hypothetical protein [Phycisphaerae bacterium]